jgi:hypothetical protein
MSDEYDLSKSSDWSLCDLRLGRGLELILERFFDERGNSVESTPKCRVSFCDAASWAFVDMSRMSQYFPADDCPPVVQELSTMGNRVFVGEFSINSETFGEAWRHFRITANDDVVEVIAKGAPQIETVS